MLRLSFSYPRFDAELVARRLWRPWQLPAAVIGIVLDLRRVDCRLARVE
jgi:hypothetical protein